MQCPFKVKTKLITSAMQTALPGQLQLNTTELNTSSK